MPSFRTRGAKVKSLLMTSKIPRTSTQRKQAMRRFIVPANKPSVTNSSTSGLTPAVSTKAAAPNSRNRSIPCFAGMKRPRSATLS